MYIDIIFICLVAIACYKGIKKGFIGSIFSFAAFFIGFFIATKFAASVAVYLTKHKWVNHKWIPFLSFILVLALVFVAMHLLGKILEKSAELILLGWFNKLSGIMLYLLIYGIFYSMILYYLDQMNVLSVKQINASFFYNKLVPIAPMVINQVGNLVPLFKNMFVQLEEYFKSVSNKS
jgi:membrane protein required for colicin V production